MGVTERARWVGDESGKVKSKLHYANCRCASTVGSPFCVKILNVININMRNVLI